MSMVKTKLNGEFEIIIPSHRADRPEWYTEQGWEKPRLKAMHKVITEQVKKGRSVVYYVGSEEGEMPALCQMWGAQVFLFEPNPKVWSNTKAIWEANGLSEPYTFEGFASNEDRLMGAEVQKGFPASADTPIVAAHGFKELYQEAENYPQIKLDTVHKRFNVPTLITMDVEGSEFEVLKGAERIISDHMPVIILSLHPEFLFTQWGVYGAEVRKWLKDFGYEETLLDYQHEVHLMYTPREGNNGKNTPANA